MRVIARLPTMTGLPSQLARVSAALLLGLLVGCPQVTRPPPSTGKQTLPSVPPDLRGAALYEVNPRSSQVDILVYRAGALARFGHNHVMSVRALAGRAWLNSGMAKSGFALSFPVAALIVDDPDARHAAGEEFPPDIAQSDRDGTRRNMLRSEVLDAERYPEIKLESLWAAGKLPVVRCMVRITIKGVSRDVPATALVTVSGSHLTASGEFSIAQTDFGIQPFSVALGTLQVQDQLRVRFSVAADHVAAAH